MTLEFSPHSDFNEIDVFAELFGDTPPPPPPAAFLTLQTLAGQPHWVAWREEARNGKPTKVPYNPNTLARAKANDPATWGTRREAEAATTQLLAADQKGGVGLQLGTPLGNGYLLLAGIDLDSCLDPLDGMLEPWAAEIVAKFETYAEISPSGTGVKLFFAHAKANADALRDLMRSADGKERHRISWSRGSHCEIGLDISNRYYAVTDRAWPGAPSDIRPVSIETLHWLTKEAGPAFIQAAQPGATAATTPKRDESGSGYAFRFLVDQALLGNDGCRALELLASDNEKAGEWARRSTQREIERTWRSAKKEAERRKPVDPEALFDDDPDADADAADPVTARLNRRHAIVAVRGRTLVTTERADGSVDFGTVRDIHNYYENDRVPAGKNKTEPASARWLRNAGRRTYPNGVTFAPGGAAAGTLNLWRGWAVEPDSSASCELFLKHVREVVCRGNADQIEYVIGWLAQMVQRPDQKPGVALVLKGAKGAGKDTMADYVARMIGRRHAPTVAESDHIVGKFNARLENALLLHVQEGSWAGDRKAEGILKYITTSDRVEIERKGIDSINLPSVLRLFISANADWVVPASPDERRWAVFNVSDARRGDDGYFRALRAEMEGEGPAALLHYLQTYDLTGFNVRKAPDTEGLLDQKLASLRNANLWWFEVLSRGELPAALDWDVSWTDQPVAVNRDTLRAQYVEWMKGRRYESDVLDDARFGRQMRVMLPEIEDTRPRVEGGGRIRRYGLPMLGACREAFDRWIGRPIAWEGVE